MKRLACALAFALAAAPVSGLLGQDDVPRTRLDDPEASFPEPFSSIEGLREFDDGRVMVSDRIEQAVRLIDFADGDMRQIGQVGQGPGEYRMPDELLPLPGDATLLVDFGNMRLTVVSPDGKLTDSEPMVRPEGWFLFPRGTDARGRLYIEGSSFQLGPGREPPDSFAISRYDRDGGSVDTVAMLPRAQTGQITMGGGGRGLSFSGSGASAYQARDAWAVAPDGRVAVARHDPYRIEWLTADRERIVGPEIVYEPVEVTEADKEAWADEMSTGTVVAIGTRGGGGRAMNLPRPDTDEIDFPERKPAFPANAVSVTPDGLAWVKRHVAHGRPETYDVFDAAGRRIKQVVLPERRRLVGFGDGTLYAVYIDDDDLQWLERYRR
ncbi:MAG: hypothetical protein GWN99_15290 [Gemmatimonadetes bacterium]|uniref:Uncharacterized protein n=1 Tax=Candidatus Kutchimonas denitrificans TaxID=3056748 RepID=A0AAE4ZC76_9BACT|nr:hypothetical protein [Gemmatimonadota bacterium]NIR76662.1 hypothetical protein [Candidatus Kutchimonas denitrificans]NIS02411.1 hypothetical protein [Gemmatimonadota bacterium]NIT68315.1 hypothetical protein [Gemmatimonadota bacterium]NIU54782.1 hypothetical protein [Gemmatimonadota bacterium]